ncbi:MAG TPA: hypothetical protein VGL53_18475 [Bryobacteraceae bacterium]|jgi:hypothetical protein
MKSSGLGGLAALTVLGLFSCSRSPQASPKSATGGGPASEATMAWDAKPRDPCAPQYFDETLCQAAVRNRGYHWGGVWTPTFYTRAFTSYQDDHKAFVSSGGQVSPTPAKVYDASFKPPAKGAMVQGGFGATAAAEALKGKAPPHAAAPHHKRPSPTKRKR